VIGIGLNVSATPEQLSPPGPGGLDPTSLAIAGRPGVDPDGLLGAILDSLAKRYDGLRAGGSIRDEYARWCGTLGRPIRAELPGDRTLAGTAAGVDEYGRLLVETPDGETAAISAGDVVHLRLQS
jgi:BirA family transcriptional regulator, biotin operon repressor / biotin---[acetyl-CoA-carboxylase] ligase